MIINADDFGYSQSINLAVCQAVTAGRVNSVSLMVDMPYFEKAVNFLKKYPNVSVGLHFNLTEGERYHSLLSTLFFFVIGKIKILQVKHELERQYQLLTRTGLKIAHLDSHEHLHLFPPIFRLLCDFAAEKHIPKIRCSSFRGINAGTFKGILIQFLYGFNYWLFMEKDRIPAGTVIFLDLNWGKLRTRLPAFPGNTEIACHLSVKPIGNRFSKDRYACYSYVMGPVFGRIIKRYEMVQSPKR